MAFSSSSCPPPRTWRYDVFPSFRGEDVRKTFVSHLMEKFRSKSINSFIDNGIERSHLIEHVLLQAIRGSRILIVIFSKNYASSTWCLNELAEIHECYKEMNQTVIPIFYEVDPSHVKKQTGEFGKVFETTCEGKSEDCIERWKKALSTLGGIAGYDSHKWSGEAEEIEKISKDVLNKLLITPSDDFRDFVGIRAHIESIVESKLCLESQEARMVGIWGPSGIGKSTIARALFTSFSSQFEHRAFVSCNRYNFFRDFSRKVADYDMKLAWAEQFLSDVLGQNDIKIENLGAVKHRLKHKKVLIVLDDVDDLVLLETLVGETEWFGSGSRIIVVTQDKALLEKHDIDLIYEVDFPSEDLALQMFCQSAFGETSPPDGFLELAVEVTTLSGNLPLALNVLGSSLKKKNKAYWVEMMPRLRNGLNGKIEETLRVCYDGLSETGDQAIFLHIACFFNGESEKYITKLLHDNVFPSVSISLQTLAEKSLIRIIGSHRTVQMHSLLQKLGREIVRGESFNNPGKRQFLVEEKDISDVLTDNTGTENVLGVCLHTPDISEPLVIGENSFEGMRELQFLKFSADGWWWRRPEKTDEVRLYLPQGLDYLPRKIRLLHWDDYPAKNIPSNFKAECLVELIMRNSKLEKLWEGALPLRSLKKIDLSHSKDLKEIPLLSNATNLEKLNLLGCTSLVTLPCSIRNLKKLRKLNMFGCSNLEVLPADVNLESLYDLILKDCSRLRTFPRISRSISRLYLDGTAMEEEDCLWIGNISGLTLLDWVNCPLICMPSNFNAQHLIRLRMTYSNSNTIDAFLQGPERVISSGFKKLKEIPDLSRAINLEELDLSGCENLKEISDLSNVTCLSKLILSECKNLKEIPRLSKAINLKELKLSGCESLKEIPDLQKAMNLYMLSLNDCTSLVILPSSIQHLHKLSMLPMSGCTSLEVLPSNINLVSLTSLDLDRCSRLTSFPQLSTSIKELNLNDTAIEEVPSWIENITRLTQLSMCRSKKLRKISATIWNLKHLKHADFTDCGGLTSVSDASVVKRVTELHAERIENHPMDTYPSWSCSKTTFRFGDCFSLDRDALKFILQSDSGMVVLSLQSDARKVPTYFKHQTYGSSLIVPLSQRSLSQQVLRFKACIITRRVTDLRFFSFCAHTIKVHWKFRGVMGMYDIGFGSYSYETDHLVVFNFDIFPPDEVHDPPSQLDCNNVEFEFELQITNISSNIFYGEIEGYGVRVLNATPSLDSDDRSSETEDTHRSGKSDAERCKKRMRMTVVTSQENSNSIYGQSAKNLGLMAPNLDHSLELVGAPPHVSSRSKVPSPSIF